MAKPPPSKPKKRCKCMRALTATLTVHTYPDDFGGLWHRTDARDPNSVSSILVTPGSDPLPYITYYTVGGDVEWSLEIKDRIGCTEDSRAVFKSASQEFERNILTYGQETDESGNFVGAPPLTVVHIPSPLSKWWLWLTPAEVQAGPPTQDELFCNWDVMVEKFQGRLFRTVGGEPPTIDPANLPTGVPMDALTPQLYDVGALTTSPFICEGKQSIEVKAKCGLVWICTDCKKEGGTTPTLGGQTGDPPVPGTDPTSIDADCDNGMAEHVCVIEGWSTAAGHYNPFGGQDKLPGFAKNWAHSAGDVRETDHHPLAPKPLLCDWDTGHHAPLQDLFGPGSHFTLWAGLKLCPQILPLTLKRDPDQATAPTLEQTLQECENLDKWCKLVSEQRQDVSPSERYRALPRNPL